MKPIITVTLGPALDASTDVDVVTPTSKLRCGQPRIDPGGGGINVSRVCRRLGQSSLAVLPYGGPSGARMLRLLAEEEIETIGVEVEADTRQNVTVGETSTGQQYRFVFPAPDLLATEIDALLEATSASAADGGCIVISGSAPVAGVDFAQRVVAAVPEATVIVDGSGEALATSLDAAVFVVKPSARELAELAGRPLHTEADIEHAAREVLESSAVQNVVVSIGAGGAIAVTADETIRFRAPTVQVKSAVGAGDSMVAGIATGLSRGESLGAAVTLGVACGTATVLSEGTQLCSPGDIAALEPLVVID